MHPTRSTIAAIILGCFFFSGITGLTYEILWTRMIVRFIGSAPFAVSIVLTIFMGGLGLGSYLAGRWIDRIARPEKIIRLYALLEITIGLFAAVLPVLINAFGFLFAPIYNHLFEHFIVYNLATFIGCAILFGIPVICMGATLPILTRFYVTSLSHLGTHAGRLYGLNTLGAALGSLLCGFWMIQYLGMWGALAAAVTVNLLIGVLCFLLSIRPITFDAVSEIHSASSRPETAQDAYSPAVTKAALMIFAVSGFCSMACEVIWTRLLGLVVGPTTYSFTIVLVTFITGLALGSMIFGKLADRTGRPLGLLLTTQVAAALLILVASQFLGSSQLFYAKLIARFQDHFTYLSLAKAATLFMFMILPTLCLGATFPLVGKIFTQSVDRVGGSIGFAYAINTIGAVLGSFAAGFLLVPWLGKENALSFVIVLQLLGAALFAAVVAADRTQRTRLRLAVGIAAILCILPALKYPSFDQLLLATGKYFRFEQLGVDFDTLSWFESLVRGREILAERETGELVYHGDGIGGVTAVLQYADILDNTELSMVNSGKPDASSRGDMQTQTMSAHFPLLFHPDAKSVMVIGLASGVTAGEVLHYPIDALDVLEISPEVVEASRLFEPWNNNVLHDPRTNLIIQDARAHLTLTDRTYDVIISEPSNPWMAGLASLFTREMFAAARDHLRSDGIFLQFLHSYQMDWFTFALVGRTFADIFPNSLIVSADPAGFGNDYFLVGFKDASGLNPHNARANLPFAQRSRNVTLTRPELLARMIVAENLRELYGEGPTNTDARPRLEYNAPRLMYATDPRIFSMLASRGRLSTSISDLNSRVNDDVDLRIEYARYALSLFEPFRNMVDLNQADSTQQARYFSLLDQYCSTYGIDLNTLEDGPARDRCRDCQIHALVAKADSAREPSLVLSYLAKLLIDAGRPTEAADAYRRWLAHDSSSLEACIGLGVVAASIGDLHSAEMAFDKALSLEPRSAVAYHNRGTTHMQGKNFAHAEQDFRKAVELQPQLAEAHCNLGLALIELGRPENAVEELTVALRLRPDFPAARRGLLQATTMRDSRP